MRCYLHTLTLLLTQPSTKYLLNNKMCISGKKYFILFYSKVFEARHPNKVFRKNKLFFPHLLSSKHEID